MKNYLILFQLFSLILLNAQPNVEKISVQLQWVDQFQFAGYYVAKEKGFYKDAGLEVTIQKFNPKQLAVDEVMSGKSTYGIGRSSLLVDRMRGKDVVVLSAIFQSSPFILLSEKSLDIKTPRDLIGKRIMMTEDFQDTISIRVMLNSQGIGTDDLRYLEHSYNPMDLANGKTDVMACYISNEPFILKEKGIETNAISPEAYGFDFYSDILFTSESEIKNHPKRVRAFVDATLKGWEYAFEHIPETAQLIRNHYNTQNKSLESLIYEGEVLKSLAFRANQPLGAVTLEKFRRISDIYRVMGIPQNEKRLEGFIYEDTAKQSIPMSVDERSFLHTNTIRYTAMNPWPPFYFNAGEQTQGIAIDFLDLIAQRTGMKSHFTPSSTWGGIFDSIKTKKLDVVIGTSLSKEKERYALFSKPYASFDHVIVTNKGIDFLSGISALKGKRVAIAQGYDLEEAMVTMYPKVTVIRAEDSSEALRMLSSGRVDAVIDILPVVAYLMNTDNHVDLKISGTTEFVFDLRMMIRNDYPELKAIIDKAIDSLTVAEKQRILNRYIAITYEDRVDYGWLLGGGSIALMIISIFVYRQFEMGKYHRKLLKMATTDPLTGLANRIRLDQKLIECYQSFQRNERSFSVIMIDLDNFKRVNDTYGHLIGDTTLVNLAHLLSENVRNTDTLGRWGGEEFMIICPETTIDGGEQLAQKIKSVIENFNFPNIHTMTCSFGISEIHSGDRIENVVGRADRALYRAKEEGRNRISIA
jgi:polar amino acid transport system substrate-binding protein